MAQTPTMSKRAPSREGKVLVSIYVDPGVRRGLNLVSSFDDVSYEEFLKPVIREALESRGLPIPEVLRQLIK